ncbi:MAG: nitrous oxide reductase accessory protein NosL [Kangiellaceae bacterium]|nr:nitrous oxide reductase accessory protein NosL [Kangiellaceae bacterium]MCW9000285.1 nitrous oxide reductase accessory protein NosL [Kangiellaceae bacterium]
MPLIKKLSLVFLTTILVSCGSSEDSKVKNDPVAFEKTDECHVCGMVITRFPGPKGQAFDKRGKQVKKFCSSMELIYWYLQPENQPNVTEIYVHNMAKAPWEGPTDEHLISARDAYFVVGSDLNGSMGKTLATFLSVNDASEFSQKHGGQVVSFYGLTLELLSNQ